MQSHRHIASAPLTAFSWRGAPRFGQARLIGSGTASRVYEALDRRWNLPVAIKAPRVPSSDALASLRREFRIAAGLIHPNIVAFYELVEAGDQLIATMEPVTGRSVTTWAGALDEPRRWRSVCAAFRDIASALDALHRAGHVHRDLKPSNVLVTDTGRAVLLDLGLAADLRPHAPPEAPVLVGTPAYMSPEQLSALPATPADDVYALGVLLVEALMQRRPFLESSFQTLIEAKRREGPAVIREALGNVPPDLHDLCAELLSPRAERRPGAAALVERFAALSARQPSHHVGVRRIPALVGREAEERELVEALTAPRRSGVSFVHVRGPSGIGKSTLLDRCLAVVAAQGVPVLAGRSRVGQSIPFRTLDGPIHALVQHLLAPRGDQPAPAQRLYESIAPEELALLGSMFPELSRFGGRRSPAPPSAPPDHRLLASKRFQAASTLAELLHLVARDQPIVLALDDVHCGDADSAAIIDALTQMPGCPPIHIALAYRTDVPDRGAFLRRLHGGEAPHPPLARVATRTIELAPLSPADSERLARQTLETRRDAAVIDIASTLHFADGNPFLIESLILHAPAASRDAAPRAADPSELFIDSLGTLPATARAILELVCVAHHPVPRGVLAHAAEAAGQPNFELALLADRRLVREAASSSWGAVEPYHDLIRAAIHRHQGAARRARRHASLAASYRALAPEAPAAIAFHYEAAGAIDAAAPFAVAAAERAMATLAFGEAAAHYDTALRSAALSPTLADEAAVGRARALAAMGRDADAAEAFLAAAGRDASPRARLDLRRQAAEHFLRAGRLARGSELAREVLEARGLTWPRNLASGLLRALATRLAIRLSGRFFEDEPSGRATPRARERVDTLWSMALGLAVTDTSRGTYFTSRAYLEAEWSRDAYLIARSAALEAAHLANAGPRVEATCERLLRRAEQAHRISGDDHSHGWVAAARAICFFHAGRWRDSVEAADLTEAIFDRTPQGSWKEIASAQMFGLAALSFSGRGEELIARHQRLDALARHHGDRFTAFHLHAGFPAAYWLMLDQPEEGLAVLDRIGTDWKHARLAPLQIAFERIARRRAQLYLGEGQAVLDTTRRERWSELGLLTFHIRAVLVAYHYDTALATLTQRPLTGRALDRVRRCVAVIRRAGTSWSPPFAAAIEAGAAAARGDRRAAERHLRDARAQFMARGMAHHVAACDLRRGELLGGADGRAQVERAEASLRATGVLAPGRYVRVLAPQVAAEGPTSSTGIPGVPP